MFAQKCSCKRTSSSKGFMGNPDKYSKRQVSGNSKIITVNWEKFLKLMEND